MTGDVTYFNGVEVGRERWDGVRSYRVPAKLLRKGKNVIAVRLLSEWGNGRLGDEASDPYLHSADNQVRISLKGQWKYNGEIEPKLPVGRGYSNNITCMYNTKIALCCLMVFVVFCGIRVKGIPVSRSCINSCNQL